MEHRKDLGILLAEQEEKRYQENLDYEAQEWRARADYVLASLTPYLGRFINILEMSVGLPITMDFTIDALIKRIDQCNKQRDLYGEYYKKESDQVMRTLSHYFGRPTPPAIEEQPLRPGVNFDFTPFCVFNQQR